MQRFKNFVTKYQNLTVIIAGVIFFVALATYYATAYPCHLIWQEQNQIFLNDPSWISTYFDKPAWLGCLAGDWLTQFYLHTVLGSIIQALAITLCVSAFAAFVLRLLPKTAAWVLTLLFALLMTACSFPSSTRLSFYLCIAGGMGFGLINLNLPLPRKDLPLSRKRYINLTPLLIPAAYWSFGFGSLLTSLFIVLLALKRNIKKKDTDTTKGAKRGIDYRWGLIAIFFIIFATGTPALLCNSYSLPYAKALLYPGIARPSLPQRGFEEHLAVAEAFYNRDLDKTKQLALKTGKPDEITSFYYYLANAAQDSLADNLLKYPVKSLGTLTTIGETTPLQVINMMNDLYYELGDMTYAERAAMMRNVFSPRNRNVRMIRRLAEINLVSGDTLAALKYLRILDRTNAYSGWSKSRYPGQTFPEAEEEIMSRRLRSNKKDNIRLGDNCRNIILELLESNPRNTVALDYLLCTDLLLKDMDTFKMDYDTYCMAKGAPRYKDLYQQALMIYLAGTEAPQEDWERYIVSDRQMQLFNRYSNRRGDASFRGTYWYYFDKE